MPVPRPVTSAAVRPVKAAMRQAAGVELAMPMSPVTSRSAPPAMRSPAAAAPASTAAAASARLMAGPSARSAVPGRTRARRKRGWSGRSDATPTSRTSTSAPTVAAMALTAAVPEQKPAIMAAVTRGQGDTPGRAPPWSPGGDQDDGPAVGGRWARP